MHTSNTSTRTHLVAQVHSPLHREQHDEVDRQERLAHDHKTDGSDTILCKQTRGESSTQQDRVAEATTPYRRRGLISAHLEVCVSHKHTHAQGDSELQLAVHATRALHAQMKPMMMARNTLLKNWVSTAAGSRSL